MRKKIFTILILASLMGLNACYYDNAALLYPGGVDCSGTLPTYAANVAPLIQSRCAMSGCHSTGVSNTGGALTNYSEIKAKAAVIKTTVVNGSMPKGSTFTAAEIKTITCWVDNGALNN